MTLGLRPGVFYRDARLYCLNLLLTYPEACYANCSYCGLRRAREDHGGRPPSFIRVEWPVFSLEEIIGRTRGRLNLIERICVSMTMHPRAYDDTIFLVRHLRKKLGLPVSVLANPSTMEEGSIEDLSRAGADMVSVAIDAATAGLFDRHRGGGVGGPHKWDLYWRTLDEAALILGRNRAGCHLIAGLGETEREMVGAIARVRRLGGRSHLFSFYPEEGSLLAEARPCSASHFRRIQLARFLIDYDMVDAGVMEFDEYGRITGYGLEGDVLDELVRSGTPFMTSGCPGKNRQCACNRPFGDGPPGDIRSFPFAPQEADIRQIRKELATYQETVMEEAFKS